jgi:hypothetical protein
MIRNDHKHGLPLGQGSPAVKPNQALASGSVSMTDVRDCVHAVEFYLVDVPLTLVHNASGDYGGVKIGSFDVPRHVLCLGGTITGTLTCATAVNATAMECGIGTTTAVAATALALPYDDLVDGVSATWSASGTLPVASVSDATLAVSNGTATVKDIFLNFAGATTVVTADAAATFTGRVRFLFADMGDI